MAAYSLSSFFPANARGSSSLFLANIPKRLRLIKVQSFQEEEGRSTSSIVDANMNVLRERMKTVKVKEGLERCCRCQNGWNYKNIDLEYDQYHLNNTKAFISNSIHLTALVCATLGSTILSGTLFLCLVSLIVHLH